MELTPEEREAIEQRMDRIFLSVCGRTCRPGEIVPVKVKSDPSTNGDSLGQVVHDFRTLLGDD